MLPDSLAGLLWGRCARVSRPAMFMRCARFGAARAHTCAGAAAVPDQDRDPRGLPRRGPLWQHAATAASQQQPAPVSRASQHSVRVPPFWRNPLLLSGCGPKV